MKRLSIKVYGRVQGVGFRYFTYHTASLLSVTGWVRNCEDLSVEMEAQGEASSLENFLLKIQEGPRYGEVSAVIKEPIALQETEKGFRIRD